MLYQDQSDETLVMLTLAGEQKAYEVLVVRYERAVLAAANSVIRNEALAEDAAQDAFITAWMKLNVLREPSKYSSWVCRIARNCAKNTVMRFRSYLSLDVIENTVYDDEYDTNPEAAFVSSEEKELLHKNISELPEKVRNVINLHYFEGLSIADIADRMRISEGTVKWHLHEGRKKIRKELSAMNETIDDTLVQRVMKKVEELKLWQLKNSKNGFEKVYKSTLKEVEELPESKDKYHAMADVLMRGWWWLPGGNNDALLSRIAESAAKGKNEEVMSFLVKKEDSKLSGYQKIAFIREKQIPRLEKEGFTKALGEEWFWLGVAYIEMKLAKEALEAFDKVLTILKPSDFMYVYAMLAMELEKKVQSEYKDKRRRSYRLHGASEEYRLIEKEPCRWKTEWFNEGGLYSVDTNVDKIFYNASLCDGKFTDGGLNVGDTFTASDNKTTLIFASACEKVTTPCGDFENCQLWITKHGRNVFSTYYKKDVGIVKQESVCDGISDVRTLKAYNIVGGTGLIPFATGNTWEYEAPYPEDVIRHNSKFTVYRADESSVMLTHTCDIERLKYDENSWLDMISQIRSEYFDGEKVCDVTHAIERAEALAKTPMEKAHTKAAGSVARRIMATNPTFNPDYVATGHWNFFDRNVTEKQDGKISITSNFRYSFELKNTDGISEAVLNNDIYSILQDAAECIWSDTWKDGAKETVEHLLWGSNPLKTEICCENVGEITTKAGVFENCLKVALDVDGPYGGWAYRGGKREYYFAPGIGIVKAVSRYDEDTKEAIYELTSYEGIGDGYMPLKDGMTRRFDAIGLTDGYVASVDYYYVDNGEGTIVIFEDRCGIRKKPEKITRYDAILGETEEDELWDKGDHDGSRLRCAVNHLNILLHIFGRDTRCWARPERGVAWSKHKLGILEAVKENGELPRAWWGLHASMHFGMATRLFGCGRKEEGYEALERAFELYEKWQAIPVGELLEFGDKDIFSDIKFVKGKNLIELPDGKRETLTGDDILNCNTSVPYHGMTAVHGWEWFDGVRNEERFKAYIERAKKLIEG